MCSRLTPRRTVSNSSCLATPDKSGQSPMTTKTAVSRAHRTALACRTIHGESQHAHPDVSECRTVESIPGHRHAASNHRQRVIPGLRRPAEPAGRERGQRSHVHELLALWVGAAHTLSADVGVSQLDFCRLRSPCHLRRGCRTGVSCVAFECAAKPERVHYACRTGDRCTTITYLVARVVDSRIGLQITSDPVRPVELSLRRVWHFRLRT